MLEGEISQINLVERLVELWREKFTGAIRFENDGIIKIIYFKGGDILSASTNDRADSIDEILMRAGKVTRDHVKQAVARRKDNETLGDALLNLGFITRKELTWARRVQVVGVIRSIVAWTEGSFTIVADYLPKRDEGTLFPLAQVLVELIVTDQDRSKFEAALAGGSAVFEKTAEFDEVFRRLGLNEDADAIVAEIDGVRSAGEIATAAGGDTFNTYKLLQAFATLGILHPATAKPPVTPEFSLDDDFAAAGVSDAADVWNERTPVVAVPGPVHFGLDETGEGPSRPTVELPSVSFDEPRMVRRTDPGTRPVAPDVGPDTLETIEEPLSPPPPPSDGWDLPPDAPVAIPIPAAVEPPAAPEEEQWGFDQAQVEAARQATEPGTRPRPKRPTLSAPPPRRRSPALIVLLVLAILGAAGYFAYDWWQTRQTAAQPEPAATVNPPRPAPAPPVETGTIVPVTTAPPASVTIAPATATETAATATTESAAPVAIPAPAAATPAAAPDAGRERYDEMARQFAASASGSFTVQIQILCDPGNLQKALDDGGSNVWFVPQQIGARSCYRVLWGRYETREEAQRALAQVPAELRDPSAAVKPVPR